MARPDILDYFPPGLLPRPAQVEILRRVQAGWDGADVLVLLCPPASGKTEIAYTIAHWRAASGGKTNYLVPDNVLVHQTAERYPELTALLRKSLYKCTHSHHSPDLEKACAEGQYRGAKIRAAAAKVRLMNSHVYRANRLWAGVAIFDEAHKLSASLEDSQPICIWQHDYKFPAGLSTIADVIAWGQSYIRDHPDEERLIRLMIEISRVRDTSTVEYCLRSFRGEPKAALLIQPCVAQLGAKLLWPAPVGKIVLMSATIGPKDVAELGLDKRRVLYLSCDSPIPATQRPVVFKGSCNMTASLMRHSLPLLAKEIEGLLAKESGKGLIHLPYNLTSRLQSLLHHPRLMWHTKRNKQEVLAAYRDSLPSAGCVLVCSGLYEGVDLPFDDDSWQVIGKVPYLSLGDEAVKAKMTADPDWYDWQAIKLLLQAYGRLPRRPDGRGTTYIFDTNYARLVRTDRSRKVPFFPIHYMAATQGGTK